MNADFDLFTSAAKAAEPEPIISWESLHITAQNISDRLQASDPFVKLSGQDRENLVSVTNRIGLGTLALLIDNPSAPFSSAATRIERMKEAAAIGQGVNILVAAGETFLENFGTPPTRPPAGEVSRVAAEVRIAYAEAPGVKGLRVPPLTVVAVALDQLDASVKPMSYPTREALKKILLSAHP